MLGREKEEREHARYVEVHHPDHRGVQRTTLIRDGRIGQTMETILGNLQPEAAYFCPIDGKRGGYLVFNMEEASDSVTKLEPFWLELGATIETVPVMNADELRAGLQRL